MVSDFPSAEQRIFEYKHFRTALNIAIRDGFKLI